MNYLAHLFLAENTPDSRLGNLLGDFLKGSLETYTQIYSPAILHGIKTHQKIDYFTDHHPIFRQSKRRLSSSYQRVSGIIIDITYDHFLANHWLNFSEQSLENFVKEVYQILIEKQAILPPRLQKAVPFIIQENWLQSYQKIEGINITFQRTSRRIKRANNLGSALSEVLQNYTALEADFLAFFPELMTYVQTLQTV